MSSNVQGRTCFWLNGFIEWIVEAKVPTSCRYLGSLVLVFIGLWISLSLKSFTGMFGIPITIVFIVAAAIFGGVKPGVLSAVVGAIGIDLFLIGSSSRYPFLPFGLMRILFCALISAVVSVLVSALRASFERAETARVDAEKCSSEKDAVIAFLSHDLRGPLSTISLSFQLMQKYLEKGHSEEELRRLCSNGIFYCQRMTRLIQTLLDASRIKSGGLSIHPGWLDVKDLAQEVFQEHRLLADEKGLSFLWRCVAGHQLPVEGDRVLLSQAISNLVLNAFKFTPAGGTVTVLVDESPCSVRVSVLDTGPGILPEAKVHLFDKFWQAKREGAEGIGLGLFLSRAIVEAHKGEILVSSEPGRGSQFTVLLPKQSEGCGDNRRVSLAHAVERSA